MFGNAVDIEQAFGDHRAMSRTRVRRRQITVFLVAVGLGVVLSSQVAGALGSSAEVVRPATQRTYVVRHGDTLWAIASRTAQGRDPREVVDAIETANGVDAGSLQPGTLLRIPSLG
jgi:nucleoid-associated protein YgaU